MAAICIMLVMMHRRHRLKHYQEIYEYCDEQIRHVSNQLACSIVCSLKVKQAPAVSPQLESASWTERRCQDELMINQPSPRALALAKSQARARDHVYMVPELAHVNLMKERPQ